MWMRVDINFNCLILINKGLSEKQKMGHYDNHPEQLSLLGVKFRIVLKNLVWKHSLFEYRKVTVFLTKTKTWKEQQHANTDKNSKVGVGTR